MGLLPRQMVADRRGTVALEEHARFHREVRAGGMMVGRSAPVEIGEKTMTVYHEFRDQKGQSAHHVQNRYRAFRPRSTAFDAVER